MSANKVLNFWFEELRPEQWFKSDPLVDMLITEQFGEIHLRASLGELSSWRESSQGRLAEIIVLDQFSRNIYRSTPGAFANDNVALILAQEAVRVKADENLTTNKRAFMYMPFMHSESSVIHQTALELFDNLGVESYLEYEVKHRDIIERFGRYPHRNDILGRQSTQEEIDFLKQSGSSF